MEMMHFKPSASTEGHSRAVRLVCWRLEGIDDSMRLGSCRPRLCAQLILSNGFASRCLDDPVDLFTHA